MKTGYTTGRMQLLAVLLGMTVIGSTPHRAQEPAPSAVDTAPLARDLARITGTPPSRFGKLTSRRWAYGESYRRESLAPVPNPDPDPEPQPRRDHPFDVAVSGDGTKVYVGLMGSELQPGSEVAVYDIVADRVRGRIPLRPEHQAGPPGSSPYRLMLHPGGRYLVVTNRFSTFASVIDTTRDVVAAEIPLDAYMQGMAFTPDGKTAYIANRYLDQVFVVDVDAHGDQFQASMRILGGLDAADYIGDDSHDGLHARLVARCGESSCHDQPRGGFVAGPDATHSFVSALSHIVPGAPEESRLLRAAIRTRYGGYADRMPPATSHAGGTVVFNEPETDPDYQAVARWIADSAVGPGIPVGNPRSKPKVCALTSDGQFLLVGNTGTQDISIVDTQTQREIGAIYLQNVVNDVKIYQDPDSGRDYLLVTTEGIGFGVAAERDPYGGESWDPSNPAAQFSVWRDLETGRVLPREDQEVLGPYDAVDGTAAIKFRDIQNDIVLIDLGALDLPAHRSEEPTYLLLANRYESHRNWVRYTSDTAESTAGDLKGDIPPDLMRVVGALPEKIALVGDRAFVTLQGSAQVQAWRIDPSPSDPSDFLTPEAVYSTGLQPIGIAAGPPDTPAAGKLFVANFLGGSLTIVDIATGETREVVIDPSVTRIPVPATNAERGEIVAHTAAFSSDGDTSCVHCHYLDMGDGRAWGVSQVLGQEYLSEGDEYGQFVIGGTMTVPQMRGLFQIQPFFLEGVLSAFEPRSMLMEHAPADDFARPTPQGDYRDIEAHVVLRGVDDIQSAMDASSSLQATLEERREAMIRDQSLALFGKAFTLRDLVRFVGEWQIHEPRLLPMPFDRESASVRRGQRIFEDPQTGCATCHPPPNFAKKDFPNRPEQAFEPVVPLTVRDGSFTLIGMNRLDFINGLRRDLEPWDAGRAEEHQGHFTSFPLRGIWDRPPVFLHNGMARTLREVLATPGNPGLRTFKYEPRVGGAPERPGRREVGFNTTGMFAERLHRVKLLVSAGARIGNDTHGGTSQLTAQQLDDLVNFLNTIE